MASLNGILISAVLLSTGLLAAAKEAVQHTNGGKGGLRRKEFRRRGVVDVKRGPMKQKKYENVMDEEDIDFWTRLLQDEGEPRGKETGIGSMPVVQRPPARE
eukprot:CAMPEP_0183711888 /NCGR_PEP_ID=MMETSP0737-20130205/7235_1 /TAXON_ID=385413 /ORGANISM="Thalassiosira miniscula, Strain CCMP1093" /LENGTH=101 /DNA_ID=CAMNT_0025940455 /DNA_START=67 /DNA_END=372 /DNA_ORIENTATION=+